LAGLVGSIQYIKSVLDVIWFENIGANNMTTKTKQFNRSIICCYLYIISKYGYPPPAEKIFDYLKKMKSLGFQSVELEGIREEHLMKMYEMREDTKNMIDKLELEVPYFCVILPGLSSTDKSEQEQNLHLFEKGCEIAYLLNAKGVLDNAPLPPYQFPSNIPVVRHYDEEILMAASFPVKLNWQQYWNVLIETYRSACDIAANYGLTYHMHPCLGVLSATTDGFLYFYDAVGRDNLRFNLDTANQYLLKDNLMLSLQRLGQYIDYIHISDNGGFKVEHLNPGDGTIHWDIFFETLKKINFKGNIGLDVGGEESDIKNIDEVYVKAAEWLTSIWIS
jgi:sugar phosphate isomerase/epimerase